MTSYCPGQKCPKSVPLMEITLLREESQYLTATIFSAMFAFVSSHAGQLYAVCWIWISGQCDHDYGCKYEPILVYCTGSWFIGMWVVTWQNAFVTGWLHRLVVWDVTAHAVLSLPGDIRVNVWELVYLCICVVLRTGWKYRNDSRSSILHLDYGRLVCVHVHVCMHTYKGVIFIIDYSYRYTQVSLPEWVSVTVLQYCLVFHLLQLIELDFYWTMIPVTCNDAGVCEFVGANLQ